MYNPVSMICQTYRFICDVLFNSAGYEQVKRYNSLLQQKVDSLTQNSCMTKLQAVQGRFSELSTLSKRVDAAWATVKSLYESHHRICSERQAALEQLAPIALFLDTVERLSHETVQDCTRLTPFFRQSPHKP